MKKWFILLLLPLLVTACGYHLIGRGNYLPADIRVIRVPMFQNKSFKYGLETTMTQAVIERLNAATDLQVVAKGKADAEFSGQIINYSLQVKQEDASGKASRYQIVLSMKAKLVRIATNEVIWQDNTIYAYQDLDVSANMGQDREREREAIQELAEDTAERVVTSLIMNF